VYRGPRRRRRAASAAVAYRPDDTVRATWALDGPTVAAFSTVPDVRLRDATLTDANGDVGITFSVDNVGERDGVFSGTRRTRVGE
jgi:hypothetical protein